MDLYFSRAAIFRELSAALPKFQGVLLDVGCGRMPYRPLLTSPPSGATRYVGLDLESNTPAYTTRPDLIWDGRVIPLPDNTVDSAIATEVLEHCPDPLLTLSEISRVLRPGGFFFITVPFLWPLHDVPGDEFRYTPYSLRRLLEQAGFTDIGITALGGWDASLAQMLGLWVRRRPMNENVRRGLQRAVMPVYRWLLKHDEVRGFEKPGMITGMAASMAKSVR